VLYVVLLSPVLILCMALAIDVGALQLQRERLASALDQSVVVASSFAALAGTSAGLDPQTAVVELQTSLVENLTPLDAIISGATPREVALSADVAVVSSVPSRDPFGGPEVITHPTIEARIRVPVSTGLLAVTGMPSTTLLTLIAHADLSFTGPGG